MATELGLTKRQYNRITNHHSSNHRVSNHHHHREYKYQSTEYKIILRIAVSAEDSSHELDRRLYEALLAVSKALPATTVAVRPAFDSL